MEKKGLACLFDYTAYPDVHSFFDLHGMFVGVEPFNVRDGYGDVDIRQSVFVGANGAQQRLPELFFPQAGAYNQFEIEVPYFAPISWVATVLTKTGHDNQVEVAFDGTIQVAGWQVVPFHDNVRFNRDAVVALLHTLGIKQ